MSLNKMTLDEYLTDLSSDKPSPGGGAAVALIAAQGVALLSMTLTVSGENPHILPSKRHQELAAYLEKARTRLVALANKDTDAYPRVMNAYKLPKQTDAEKKIRADAIQAAYKAAADVPFATMEEISEILDNAIDVVRAGKAAVISDAAIAIDILYSSLKTSRHNIKINLKYIKDEHFCESALKRMKKLTSGRKQQRQELQDMIQEIIATK